MNMPLVIFKGKLENSSYTRLEAIDALKLYAEAGEPIPKELIPYLDQVRKAWADSNKTEVKNTDLKWSCMVWDVRLQYRLGSDVGEAVEIVANNNDVAFDTLERKYKGSKYNAAKKDADMLYEATPGGWSK